MSPVLTRLAFLGLLAAATAWANAFAAVYAGWGTLAFNRAGPDFSLCFVGDAVDNYAARVLSILEDMRHIEWAANLRFHPPGNKSIRLQSEQPLTATDWRCPETGKSAGPLKLLRPGDVGDVRILVYTTGNSALWNVPTVGGHGCAIVNVANASWGATGNEPKLSKWCDYNVKLGDKGPPGTPNVWYLNHTLHELGHKLGFDHEHLRSDSGCPNGPINNGGTADAQDATGTTVTSEPIRFLTTNFDKESVMNYPIASCGSIGDVGFTGFSAGDRLGLRILYPETNQAAELTGTRVVQTGRPLRLGNLWKADGASVNNTDTSVAHGFSWRIDGSEVATTSDLDTKLDEGKHDLVYSYTDFLGRSYSFQTEVEILSPDSFSRRMASQSVIIGVHPH